MKAKKTVYYLSAKKCADEIIKKVGKDIMMGIPLALGKPNQLVNELYRRAKNDPGIRLKIMTAISLEKPTSTNELERRIIGPLVERIFGDFPDFEYLTDLRNKTLPPNFELIEFFNKSGSFLNNSHVQQNYMSTNYTHAPRDIFNLGLNVSGQLLAKKTINGRTMYSMSCNPDTPIEVGHEMREQKRNGIKNFIVGQVNTNLPFMHGDAVVPAENFDAIIDNPDYNFKLFSPPKTAVLTDDYMIGVHTSSLIKDGGTIQIGIGSLGDAIAASLQMRQDHNDVYNQVIDGFKIRENFGDVISQVGETDSFKEGLYGSSEMFVDGFMNLYKSGIIKRKVYDDASLQQLINDKKIQEDITPRTLTTLLENRVIDGNISEENFNFLQKFGIFKENLSYQENTIVNGRRSFSTDLSDEKNLENIISNCLGSKLKNGVIMHGSFFIGPQSFYDDLNNMSDDDRKLFNMTSVQYVNQLYRGEKLKTLQRKKARYINAGMFVNILGAVTSDGLEDGNVVSGVGGQYNFVSMAHALDDARGIMMIKSTRRKNGKVSSNIMYSYGHTTIPRHLRDIVVTEYGIADLRSKRDCDVIASLLNVTDSRFQEELLFKAKKSKKIRRNYEIPERFRNNYPEELEKRIAPFKEKGFFNPFPFGTDLTGEEIVLIGSLRTFKDNLACKKISLSKLAKTIIGVPAETKPYLERMQLDNPASLKEKMLQKVVVYSLLTGGRL